MKTRDLGLTYPTKYEIEQTLSSYCSRAYVDRFAQSRGIFISKANQEELSHHLSTLFFEHHDLEEIRAAAYKESSFSSLSGFVITSQEDEFEPIDILDRLRGENDLRKGVILSAIAREEEKGALVKATGRMDYFYQTPGRIEFLHNELRSVEYTIKPLDKGSYQVFVESNKSTDATKFENFVKKKIGKEVRLDTLDIKLISDKTVLFFDALAESAMSSEWQLSQVKHLVLRRGDGEEEELAGEALSGINQAILDGKNLRNSPLVKQAEANGYQFTAMTLEYQNKDHPFWVDISAEFKFRPIVFEVGVSNYRKVVGKEEDLEKAEMDSKEEIEMKTKIWEKAREIYKTLVGS